MLERTISRKVVEWLYGHEIIERSESNIYVYAYELLISSTISIFLILIASCVCGNIWYSLAFLLGFIPLRIYLGGYHASSHFNCYLAFLSVFLASVVLSYQIVATYGFRLMTTCLLFIIAFLYAPVEAKNKRLPTEKKRKYRHISICCYTTMSIKANGDIAPSPYLPLSIGNIRCHTLQEYWDSGYPKIWKLPILKKMASTLNTVDDMQCDSMGYNTWIDRDYSCDIIDEHLME